MKQILTGITAAVLALSVQAQGPAKAAAAPSPAPASAASTPEYKGALHEHQELIKELRKKNAKTVEMAFQASTTARTEFFYWTQRYWLTSNDRMKNSGYIFSYIPENDQLVLANFIRSQRYDWLYVLPNMAVLAQEHGYIPNCYLNIPFESVIVVPEDSGISNTLDLKGKKIGHIDRSNDSRIVKYTLHLEDVSAKYVGENITISDLASNLTQKKYDAITLRKEDAEKVIKTPSGKGLKIFASAPTVPGAVMLAHSRVPQEDVNVVTKACVETSPEAVARAAKFDSETIKEGAVISKNTYLAYEEDHLKFMRAALGFVEPEYSRNIFNPKTNMFTDLHEVFTEPPKKGSIRMTLGSQGKTASASIAAAQGSELKPEMYNLSAPKPEVKAAPEVKPAASAPAPVSSAAKVDSPKVDAKPAAVETKPVAAPKTDAKPEVKADAAKAETPKGK